MNWAWADALDQLWRSPAFPTWLTLAAAGFFGLIGIVALLRAEKSIANGALTVITLLAIGIAAAATTRGFGSSGNLAASDDSRSWPPATAELPALSCIDDLAGEVVLNACEKILFGSAESTAAALSYAARQITRLTGLGDVSAANKAMTPELEALRRAVERDRYGLMAQVLVVRDHCTPSSCAAFFSLTDRRRVVANMQERIYDGLIARYSAVWNSQASSLMAPVAALVPGVPTGKPTNAEFPSASSTPPVSIMTAEPSAASASAQRPAAPSATAPSPAPRPTAQPALAAAKKPPAPKPARTSAPVSLAPAAPAAQAAPAPAATNE